MACTRLIYLQTCDILGAVSYTHLDVYKRQNLGFDGMKAHFVTPEGEFDAHIHIPGEHNVYNAMAAAAVGLQLGLTIAEIKSGIEKAETIAGRTNFIKTHGMTCLLYTSRCV